MTDRSRELRDKALKGGTRYLPKLREQHKLTARERLDLLLDKDSFVEDGLFANVLADELPADGVVTGLGTIEGRQVAVMANDPTVKAGSWGARTVEKIVRIQETAARIRVPLFYLVDSAGARITDQIEMFPGRRHAGRIFFNEVQLSGVVPQICLLLGPSAAGGAYIPAFCDVVVMVEGNASMYLGSPRMVEVVVGEKVTLEELGGARMHCTESGCGDALVADDREAIDFARAYFRYMPQRSGERPERCDPRPARVGPKPISELIPAEPNRGYDMRRLVDAIIDEGSWLEIKKLFAKEILTGFARLDGHPVGVVANQPMQKGGVLFNDSADKAARFIWLCDAFEIPLLFLADVPGFMIGTDVEKRGIIRHGAKMLSAVSEATVPKISVIVRKAYGAGQARRPAGGRARRAPQGAGGRVPRRRRPVQAGRQPDRRRHRRTGEPSGDPDRALPRLCDARATTHGPQARSRSGLEDFRCDEAEPEQHDAPRERLQGMLERVEQRRLVELSLGAVAERKRAGH